MIQLTQVGDTDETEGEEMANMSRHYERSVETAVIGSETDLNEQALAVLNLAGECDRLTRQLAEDSARMSELFARFATEVSTLRHAQPPTGYSSLRDIDTNNAKLEAKREALVALIRLVYGKEALESFRAELTRRATGGAP